MMVYVFLDWLRFVGNVDNEILNDVDLGRLPSHWSPCCRLSHILSPMLL